MANRSKAKKKYAPVWMMMFSTGAALGKVAVERYLMRRVWKLSWKDGMMAFGGALLGYITYRVRYGNKSDNPLTR